MRIPFSTPSSWQHIDNVNWAADFPYAPLTAFRAWHDGDNFYIEFKVEEETTKAEQNVPGDPVYMDSCVECFIQPDPGDPHYYNLEWNAAVEIGVDRIVPVIGERSERRVFRTDRSRKIVLSAAKQSLKAAFPTVDEPCGVTDFIKGTQDGARLIACCFEDGSHPRKSLPQAVGNNKDITVLIGPEGDFSPAELQEALSIGFEPVHFGESRLRTETAAVVAVAEVYSMFNR